MAKKLTARQVKFIEIYLSNGRKAAEAYRGAYNSTMRPSLCGQEGYRLLKNPKIAPLVEEADRQAERAVERAVETYAVSRERNVAELARLAYSNLIDYAGPDHTTDLSKASRDQWAALQEVTIDELADGRRRVRFKLHDKKAAISELNRLNGWVIDRMEQGKPGDFAHLSDDELDEELMKRLTARGLTKEQARRFLTTAPTQQIRGPRSVQ